MQSGGNCQTEVMADLTNVGVATLVRFCVYFKKTVIGFADELVGKKEEIKLT